MKIVFICGCLEPGHDGVGDYTRRLAGELIRQGHQVAALSLNDRQISEVFNGTQEADSNNLPIFRVPSAWTEKERFRWAKEWIKAFDPEWLSLQFVPFSFHPKGLPFKLPNQLVDLGVGRRWHIMFHELWVGMEKEASVMDVWWGWLQRQLIKSLILNLKPSVIHTQTHLYKAQLTKLEFNINYLPLFSNIPKINKTTSLPSDRKRLSKNKKIIHFVIFGTIHPQAPVETLTRELAIYSMKNGVQISLVMIGRCGPEQEKWAKSWRMMGMEVKELGEQSPECISSVLLNVLAGISTTPLAKLEKSGAVAAMREHDLPVLCVSRSWQPQEKIAWKLPEGFEEYREGKLEAFLSNLSDRPRIHSNSNVSQVSHQLVKSLISIT